ncbi:MAG: hypothetical protein HY705_03560, partial [Gemmatimonadetes bacterium]|nr:hypothetical protein [Gemmatimonadota bacterium]
NADDTITFNHSHGCGFITCSGQSLDFSERSAFGMMSSTEPNVLDGRAVTDMVDVSYWNVFHPSEVWPSRTDAQGRAFNRYAPAGWDYDDDGVEDTLYIDNCGSQGCVPPQSDTLPGGWLNRVGQTAPLSIGPFKLAAGDTVGLMLAYVADRDSVSFQATLQNIFDLYMTFFFVPEPAPPPTLAASATAVTGGAQTETSVRLNWNDRLVTFVDPFLTKLYNDIRAADPTTDLGRILALNPWVDDSLLARSANNVAAIHVFRSCDGGATFTDDSDCNPDQIPAADQSSKFANIGWLPWRSLDAGVTSVTDGDVFAGVPFLYSMVTETRGAKWRILFDQGPGAVPTDASGNPVCQPARCIPREFEFAPAILSPLTRTPGAPGVTSVYVPITRTAGRVAATATVESALGPALVPVTFLLTRTARDGSFRALFADTLNVTTVVTSKDLGGGKRDTTAVAVTVVTSGATPQSFTGAAVLPMRGATLVRQRSVIDPTDATVTTDTVVNRIVSGGTGMVPMLVLETTGGAATPLLATGSLAVGRTTPGAFLDTPTFPGFVMDVNASVGGTFSRQVYLGPTGDTIPNDIVAGQAIEWQTGTGNARALLTGKLAPLAFSQYRLAWQDRPYGPGEEFRVSAGLQDRFTESVNARATAATSLAQDTALVRRINQALGTDSVAGLTLEALALPFEVTNVTESRDVQIAIVQH